MLIESNLLDRLPCSRIEVHGRDAFEGDSTLSPPRDDRASAINVYVPRCRIDKQIDLLESCLFTNRALSFMFPETDSNF